MLTCHIRVAHRALFAHSGAAVCMLSMKTGSMYTTRCLRHHNMLAVIQDKSGPPILEVLNHVCCIFQTSCCDAGPGNRTNLVVAVVGDTSMHPRCVACTAAYCMCASWNIPSVMYTCIHKCVMMALVTLRRLVSACTFQLALGCDMPNMSILSKTIS